MGLESAAHMIQKRLLLIELPTGRQIFLFEQQGGYQLLGRGKGMLEIQ